MISSCFQLNIIIMYVVDIFLLVVECLKVHIDQPNAVHQACAAISNLSNIDNLSIFRKSEVGPLLIEALRKHQNAVSVVNSIGLSICSVSLDTTIQRDFESHGICDAISSLLKGNKASLSIAEWVFVAIDNLSQLNENKSKFSNADNIELMNELIKLHIESERVVKCSCAAIQRLAQGADEKHKLELNRLGICSTVGEVIKRYHSNDAVVEQVLTCINALISGISDKNSIFLFSPEICNLVVDILQASKGETSRAGVCEATCGCVFWVI
jgi:hypothetical protein